MDAPAGRYQWVSRRVWIPGYFETVRVPARYRTVIRPCGQERQILVRAARTRKVWNNGYWTTKRSRVWVAY